MQKVTTKNFEQTRELGKKMAQNFQGGEVVCLRGDLGSGKTTFTQGILEALGAEKPYVSPTFMIMKKYDLQTKNHKLKTKNYKLKTIYHIDTYRISEKDLLDLGWEEIIAEKNSVSVVEWPERVENIIPKKALWIDFKWISENEREIDLVKS